jgi:uncharacterized protein YfaS (alpha-2-macroglobulin family)
MRPSRSGRFAALCGSVLLAGLVMLQAAVPAAADDTAATIARQPAGATIIPEKFLRRWDPVTIFFDQDTGPAAGGPEHQPDRFVTMEPAQPGAFTWLNPRTLQFQPAEPWPSLSRFTWHIGDKTVVLASLMDAPLSITPADGQTGLDPVETLTLEFAQPVDVKALAQMLDIEMAPLPGIDRGQAKRIDASDFTIKTVERVSRADHAKYVVAFRQPIPAGMRVTVTLGLSTDPDLNATVQKIAFSTAETFQPIYLGCAENRLPISATGATYDKAAALTCKTDVAAAPPPSDPQQSADTSNSGSDDQSGDQASDQAGDQSGDQASDNGNGDQANTTSDTQASTSSDQGSGQANPPAATPPAAVTKREIVVQFSAPLAAVDPIAARNLVRITPTVEGVKSTVIGDQLHVVAQFKADTLYQIALEPTVLKDTRQRDLVMTGRSAAYVFWPADAPFLDLAYGSGIVERYGPQMIPVHGRGYRAADVRIHAIDPLDRSFWPFPHDPVVQDEDVRPPAPGEAADPYGQADPIPSQDLLKQIQRLGTPSVSELMTLPLTESGTSARFGLDLAPALARIAGKRQPGTYLVGLRRLDKGHERDWMRVQVTDLSVSVVEEEKSVSFFVTSLSDGKPVEGAEVRLEGQENQDWSQIADGTTGADGRFVWSREDLSPQDAALGRIAVIKGNDVLVVDPYAPPDRYDVSGWYPGSSDWLTWMRGDLKNRHPAPQTLCHVFTERPIYRPDDPVHVKAYVRTLADGALSSGDAGAKTELVVSGPDDAEWTYPLDLDDNGNAHYLFDEKTEATGIYQAKIQVKGETCATATFKKDAYRLPKFQVRLDAPRTIPLDKTASVGMTATYYAGGAASDRPVRWRVTQFPYAFTPAQREGFVYATDARYQSSVPFESSATLETTAKTDGEGRAKLTLDPTREKTDQPRRYVVEATVVGDDDKTVTNTENVLALPAFVLGLKVPRYIERAKTIPVELLMVDGDGKPLSGRPVTLRLLQRQWSSILQASDFTDGKPKYRTEVVDQKLLEKTVMTGPDTVALDLPISQSGVYIVELEASDDLGRRQTVSIDLFAGGDQPVTWSRPPAQVFKVTTDKPAYIPGETANLILESPFQTAEALAIVEEPDGSNQYQWVEVTNGYGKFALPITKTDMPRIPVHFALMRGRLKGAVEPGSLLDLRRPETLAATSWVSVKPVKNTLTVKIDSPPAAQPGDTVAMTVHLSDDTGQPIAGEVTLWLIDQAVLALAQEAPLSALPNFIRDRGSHVAFSDTRNSVFGYLPLDEDPGGDVGAGDQALLNKVTIRKNFNPVPYYNPTLEVDASGAATVQIKLPDNLTNFMIRAKATSGADRFGFATGQIAVHLPVIVEPNLPRFLRPGDQFTLSAIGRVVEGPGGAGRGEAKVDGLDVSGPLTRSFTWQPGQPQHLDFPATVPTPAYGPDGMPVRQSVTVTLGVERSGDKARDAFSVDLPLKPDRMPVRSRLIADITGAKPLQLPAIGEPIRPGTLKRTVLFSTEPGIVRLMAGLTYLRQYPFGCTEQRLSEARAEIAAKRFEAALMNDKPDDRATQSVQETLAWIATVTDSSGQVAFYPGMRGEVLLTAWSVEFMVEAQQAGFTVDAEQFAGLKQALKQALRSDYGNFVSGDDFTERAWALSALAAAGELDPGYADELLRKAAYLSLEDVAQLRLALATSASADPAALKLLDDTLWKGIIIQQRDGKPVYGGLQQEGGDNPLILPSETRTLAETLRAVSTDATPDPRRAILAEALVTLGQGDGWGSTNANAEAMLALSQVMTGDSGTPVQHVALAGAGGSRQVDVGAGHPLQRVDLADPTALTVTTPSASAQHPLTVQSDVTYMPAADGSRVAPTSAGFVVTRDEAALDPTGAPAKRLLLDQPGKEIDLKVGDVVEDSLSVVNPVERHHVAIVVPLAAGMEPLNPNLKTAPPEATPSADPTLAPSYVAFLDDQVAYFYETLPAGTFSFHFRARASTPGRFIQPAAYAQMMYDDKVNANGAGAVVRIDRAP